MKRDRENEWVRDERDRWECYQYMVSIENNKDYQDLRVS